MSSKHMANEFPEGKYNSIPKENLITFSIYSVTKNGEPCTFERLVKECFTLFPKAFGFSRYPQWPDSLKFDRPLRTLRERGWIVGNPKTLFSLTKFGETIAKETEQALKGSGSTKKHTRGSNRGVDAAVINSLKESAAYSRFLKNKEQFSLTEMELRALLQCTLETPWRIVKQNLQYSKNLAAEYNDSELLDFLQACEQSVTGREGTNAS